MFVHRVLFTVLVLGLLLPGGCKDRSPGEDPGPGPVNVAEDPGRAPADVAADSGRVPADVTRDTNPAPREIAPTVDDPAPAPVKVSLSGDLPEPAATATKTISRRPTPPKVAYLLTVADLVGVLGLRGWVFEGPIPGVSPDGHYNSLLYTRPGSAHMVGVRLWERREHREAVAWWNELLATHPNAEANDSVVRDTFFWTRGSVAGLVFLEADRSRVVGVSCHTELCTDSQLLQLAMIVHGRAR